MREVPAKNKFQIKGARKGTAQVFAVLAVVAVLALYCFPISSASADPLAKCRGGHGPKDRGCTTTVTSTTTSVSTQVTTATSTSTTTQTSTSTVTSSTTETTTSTTTSVSTETTTATQTVVRLGAGFSPVTISLTSDLGVFNAVTSSCSQVTGYVWWNIGPIPPTTVSYTLAGPEGGASAPVPVALGAAFTQYTGSPPTPQNAAYTAEPFSANVCGLQQGLNVVTLYAQDSANTFTISIRLQLA